MKRQQRFSLRKFKFGLASALLGTALIFGSGQANADEQTGVSTAEASQQSSLVTTADPSEQESLSADKATVKEDKSQASEEVDNPQVQSQQMLKLHQQEKLRKKSK